MGCRALRVNHENTSPTGVKQHVVLVALSDWSIEWVVLKPTRVYRKKKLMGSEKNTSFWVTSQSKFLHMDVGYLYFLNDVIIFIKMALKKSNNLYHKLLYTTCVFGYLFFVNYMHAFLISFHLRAEVSFLGPKG